jgi:hypothetical protein
MAIPLATAEWRRLDLPGSDRCALFAETAGWRLAGEARYGAGSAESRLSYEVSCGPDWLTRVASVTGADAGSPISLRIEQSGGHWFVNGAPQAEVEGLADIDLFFTPATNLLPIRRVAFVPGELVTVTAAWLAPGFRLAPLRQGYRALGNGQFDYVSPDHDFQTRLSVHPSGLVTDYPGLWTGEVRDG